MEYSEERLIESGPREERSPARLSDDETYMFDGHLSGRFVVMFKLRVGRTECTFRHELDTNLQALIHSLENDGSFRD